MQIAIWNDTYRTGNFRIDQQHQELFRLINDLHDAILSRVGEEVLGATLYQLSDYTIRHFGMEEALMRRVTYPALSEHKRKHDQLAEQVKGLRKRFDEGRLTLTITLSNFLADWLRHHIKEDDLAMIKYVQNRSCVALAGQ